MSRGQALAGSGGARGGGGGWPACAGVGHECKGSAAEGVRQGITGASGVVRGSAAASGSAGGGQGGSGVAAVQESARLNRSGRAS